MNKSLRLSLCFLLYLACMSWLPAETVIKTVEVEAEDKSQEGAICNALIEAIREVTGVYISADKELNALTTTVITNNNQNNEAVVLDQSKQQDTILKTKGAVKSYRVLSCARQENMFWKARLSVDVALYITPGLPPDSRRKIAMIPFSARQDVYQVGTIPLKTSSITGDLVDAFNRYFTQSQRFAVLTRLDNAALKQEKNLILSEATPEEMAKIGQMLGLDYMVVGTLKQLYIAQPQIQTITETGAQYVTIPRGLVELDYRIVVVATSQIKWADSVVIDLNAAGLAPAQGDILTAYRLLMDMASRQIAAAMDTIYPIKVLKALPNGELVLDRGGALLQPGMYFDAYRQGEMMFNPVNKEPLGNVEEKVATVQITRVDAKLSYAGIVPQTGTFSQEDIDKGTIILRPYRMPLGTPPAAPKQPIVTFGN